jgi:hypothetical protein
MEPITIGLVIANGISFILHAIHLKYRCGNNNSCCQCSGELDGTISDKDNTKNNIELSPKSKL